MRVPIASIMKRMSLQRFLVVGGLTIGLVACAATAPKTGGTGGDAVAKGPLGPPPPPDDVRSSDNTPLPELPKPEITNADSKPIEAKEEMGEGGVDKDDDPLGDQVLGGLADGAAAPPPPPRAITANPKAARGSHAPAPNPADPLASAGGGSTGTGTMIQAASEVRGSLDKEEIRRVVRAHLGEVKRCYEQGLQRRPDLEGRVVLKFTVGKTGTVVAAKIEETTLNERQVEQCITDAAKKWTFPKPTGDGIVTISYPFLLKAGS